MNHYDSMFSIAVQKLLSGHFICEVSNEAIYSYLLDSAIQERVNQYLIKIDRELANTADEKAFFCAYVDVQSEKLQRVIRSQFKEVSNHLESFIRWIRLMVSLDPAGIPIAAGEVINKSVILSSIEQTPSHFEALKQLTRTSYFKSSASDASGLVKAVLSKLVDSGYLIQIGRSGIQYQATAKWSWLYDVMAFIETHENLDGETDHSYHQPDILDG